MTFVARVWGDRLRNQLRVGTSDLQSATFPDGDELDALVVNYLGEKVVERVTESGCNHFFIVIKGEPGSPELKTRMSALIESDELKDLLQELEERCDALS